MVSLKAPPGRSAKSVNVRLAIARLLIKAELIKRAPKVSISGMRALFFGWSKNPVFREQTENIVLAGLRKAGLPEK